MPDRYLAAQERYSRRRYPALGLRAPVRPPRVRDPEPRPDPPPPVQLTLWPDPPPRRDFG